MAAEDRREPLYSSVQARLRDYIAELAIEPGERLPPERELAARLGVSRTSLRQAMTALRIDGTVDVRHGDGNYLLRAPHDVIPPIPAELRIAHPELPSVGEVRNALEALAAQNAALRRSDADLVAIVAALRRMDQEIAVGGVGIDGDREFHRAVLNAAGNPFLTQLLDAMAEGSAQIASASLRRPGQPERSLAAHRLILDAIVTHEADLARRLMYEHLELTGAISAV